MFVIHRVVCCVIIFSVVSNDNVVIKIILNISVVIFEFPQVWVTKNYRFT